MADEILVLGSFVADVAFRAARLPAWGETLLGSASALGPGGKGSNQAVAAARALRGSGAWVRMASRLGDDAFGQLARSTWEADGIEASLVDTCATPTGSAAILIDDASGNNAIIVVPGACYTLMPEDVDRMANAIRGAKILLMQLELPLATVQRGLEIAREAGVMTILNPAPAVPLSDAMLKLVDYLMPNESEAALLARLPVETLEQAEACAQALLERGPKTVILTLGERGAMACVRDEEPVFVSAFNAGPVVETTGAGDAFCGGFAAALLEDKPLREAVRFGCATAGISVTRAGTAPSMPQRTEIEALLRG
jgi:ribokinase